MRHSSLENQLSRLPDLPVNCQQRRLTRAGSLNAEAGSAGGAASAVGALPQTPAPVATSLLLETYSPPWLSLQPRDGDHEVNG